MAVWKRTVLWFRLQGWGYCLFWKTGWVTRQSQFIPSTCLDGSVSCFTASFMSASYFVFAQLLRTELLQLISKAFSPLIKSGRSLAAWQCFLVFIIFFFPLHKFIQQILWTKYLKWLGDWGGKKQTNSRDSLPCFGFLVAAVLVRLHVESWGFVSGHWLISTVKSLALWVNEGLDLMAGATWVC